MSKSCFMKKSIALFLLVFYGAQAQKPVFATAKVKAATVYFNSAEINQSTSVNLPKGTSEIVVKNVADYLYEGTVQIGAPSTVTVLSVQFTRDHLSEYDLDENSPAIKKVRDSIKLVEKEILRVNNAKDSEAKTIELLDKNQQVSGTNSGLNLAELAKVVEYYKAKRTELRNSYNALEEKIATLNTTLSKLRNKLEINTQNEEKMSKGKLILQVMNEIAGNVALDINYITANASWKPFYDLRANSISEPIDMMYKAQIVQNSGIDWKQVKLMLSSGNPNQNNQAPVVQPWFLQYNNPYANADYLEKDSALQEVVVVAYGTKKRNKAEVSSVSNYTNIQEKQLNISFDIDIAYDILSNGKAHSVSLKEIQLPATYNYFAAPRIDSEAFLMAEINDYSKYNLLHGEANIIFEGMYVGKTVINPNQTSDTLNLSMGRDRKISIKREKVVDESGTKFLSSKKEQRFTYDITIRNNKKEAVQMLLKDQYPLSPDKEIEIELKESGNAKVDAETGILQWDISLRPNETKKVRISYKIRYPKNKIIDNL